MADHRKSLCEAAQIASSAIGDITELGGAEKQKDSAEVQRLRSDVLKRANAPKPTLAERRLMSLTAFNMRWGKGSKISIRPLVT